MFVGVDVGKLGKGLCGSEGGRRVVVLWILWFGALSLQMRLDSSSEEDHRRWLYNALNR